jgi:hypothetical protein
MKIFFSAVTVEKELVKWYIMLTVVYAQAILATRFW